MVHPIELVEQVGHDNDSRPGIAPPVDLLPKVHIGPLVETLVGLVEQQQVRAVQLTEDKVELLPSPAGQLINTGARPRSPGKASPSSRSAQWRSRCRTPCMRVSRYERTMRKTPRQRFFPM